MPGPARALTMDLDAPNNPEKARPDPRGALCFRLHAISVTCAGKGSDEQRPDEPREEGPGDRGVRLIIWQNSSREGECAYMGDQFFGKYFGDIGICIQKGLKNAPIPWALINRLQPVLRRCNVRKNEMCRNLSPPEYSDASRHPNMIESATRI